jgi:2-iminobutanoate/2-iminopropanoate deaminase
MNAKVLQYPLAASPPTAPYSPALAVGPFIFMSGQTGRDPATQQAGNTIEEQTDQALRNMRSVLAEADADLSHVVTLTVFLARNEDRPGMNAVYRKYFSEPFPARATVVVSLGGPDSLIEIQGIAYVGT